MRPLAPDGFRTRPIQRVTDLITAGLVVAMLYFAWVLHSVEAGPRAAVALLGAALFALSTLHRFWNWRHPQSRLGAAAIGIGDIGGMICLGAIVFGLSG